MSKLQMLPSFIHSLDQSVDEDFIHVILGPRQVGKTTGILAYLEKGKRLFHYATADEVLNPTGEWIEEHWQTAKATDHFNPKFAKKSFAI
jgi:predicted AAA+ superfamily ATPase